MVFLKDSSMFVVCLGVDQLMLPMIEAVQQKEIRRQLQAKGLGFRLGVSPAAPMPAQF